MRFRPSHDCVDVTGSAIESGEPRAAQCPQGSRWQYVAKGIMGNLIPFPIPENLVEDPLERARRCFESVLADLREGDSTAADQ